MNKRGLLFQRMLVLSLGLVFAVLGLEVLLRALGLAQRWTQTSLRRSSDACVVLCVGDSYTACPGVPRERTYPAQLEQQLNAELPPRRFQVLNLGLNGQNSTSLTRDLPANLKKFRPQVVVLLTGGANAWDFSGYQSFKQNGSVGGRVADRMGRIRVVKLARLVFLGFQGNRLGAPPQPATIPPAEHVMKSSPHPGRLLESSPHTRTGLQALARMDYREAEKSFRLAVTSRPDDPEAWDGLAVTFAETARYQEGIRASLEAIRLDPTSTKYYDHLGRLYRMVDQRQKALECYVSGLEQGDDRLDGDEKVRLTQHLLSFAEPSELAPMADRLQAVAAPRPALQPLLARVQEPARDPRGIRDWIAHDLEVAIGTCLSAGVPVVLMNYPGDHPKGLSPLYDQVARRLSVPFVDNRRSFDGLPEAEYFLPDGHCTEKGNARVASNVKKEILEMLGLAQGRPPAP